jgi:phosphoenolpyruvate synthase/pyruvate phosphate dikinase
MADEARTLGVRANADTLEDTRRARELGAEGIGLCRTEHMFMEEGCLQIVREMILSESDDALKEALVKLDPMQREDFEGNFSAMDGLPVTVRLLDPLLHEFLPDSKDLAKEVAEREGRAEDAGELRRQLRVAESLEERNPMLGLQARAPASRRLPDAGPRHSSGCKGPPGEQGRAGRRDNDTARRLPFGAEEDAGPDRGGARRRKPAHRDDD